MKTTMITFCLLLTIGAHADSVTHGGTTINMDFVDIGYAGNSADNSGYGAVGYNYRIGQKEVTVAQFAAAHAADSRVGTDAAGYWNQGSPAATVGTGGPASYVLVYDAMKFANWLTTGSAISGAYQFNAGGTTLLAIDRDAAVSIYGTVYVLPSEDEWYKAAYYKPVDDGSYSLYANGSDSAASVIHGTTSGWNYYNSGYLNGHPNYMWETGDGGLEQNGTFDMMGNIYELNESAFDGSTNNISATRGIRGGSAKDGEYDLRSSSRASHAVGASDEVGFRVAVITAPPIDLSIHPAVEIEWSSSSGTTYQVQYSTNLVSANWFDLGNSVMATDAASYAFDSTRGTSNRFYRVISE